MTPLIQLNTITKIYVMGETEVHALRGVSLTINQGEMVAIMGPSGSGKSTLMNIIGCLDRPTSGEYLLDGVNVGDLTDDELAIIRNEKIGFVFQQYMLLQRTTALRNVELPMLYGKGRPDRQERARMALEAVGMGDRLHHRPNELSGGQQQRVAIARALVNEPRIIMADEPTGALDSATGTIVMRMLRHLSTAQNKTVVVVTHDEQVARFADRLVRLKDGAIVDDQLIQHEDDPNAA